MSTDLDVRTRPRPVDTTTGDHERFAHIVHSDGPAAAKVTEAMVTGTPIKALCGKLFVPSRDASRYPVCPECREIKTELQRRFG